MLCLGINYEIYVICFCIQFWEIILDFEIHLLVMLKYKYMLDSFCGNWILLVGFVTGGCLILQLEIFYLFLLCEFGCDILGSWRIEITCSQNSF